MVLSHRLKCSYIMLFSQFHCMVHLHPGVKISAHCKLLLDTDHLGRERLELLLSGSVLFPLVENNTEWPMA